MVYYYLVPDEAFVRWSLGSLKDMGATHAQALIYWWREETRGGDYWKASYRPEHIGANYRKALDLFVNVSLELGMKPAFRLGGFRSFKGLWHPMDPSRSIEPYADWVRRVATRYRGKVHHYVVGDEENKGYPAIKYYGSAEAYLKGFLIPMSKAIRAADPDALISSCATSSSPATQWNLDLIRLGLPQYADGIACNLPHRHFENPWEVQDLMAKARSLWPEVKFFANGVGYAENFAGPHDELQATRVAQSMFTLWDLGWDNAPYYLYKFSLTADTRQDFGIVRFPAGDRPAIFSDAWRAFQTIAQTFYDRAGLKAPDFPISLDAAHVLTTKDGVRVRLAPPSPLMKTFARDNRQLLIYLAYPNLRYPQEGRWDITLNTTDWGGPQQIPLLNYRRRIDLAHRHEGERLVIENVSIGRSPTIVTLRRRVASVEE